LVLGTSSNLPFASPLWEAPHTNTNWQGNILQFHMLLFKVTEH
jgi:hypothetical protein